MSNDHNANPADPRLRPAASQGCEESRLLLTRRGLLGVTAGLFSTAFMPRLASAATMDPRLLVVVLRGGMDGLSAVPPCWGTASEQRIYLESRGELYFPPKKTFKLGDIFGLHPSLRTFHKFYQDGDAAVVHAACVPLRTRSHFDCQDNLENGQGPAVVTNSTGWLSRMLGALDPGEPIRARGAIEIGQTPLILRGPEPVLGWSGSAQAPVLDPTLSYVRELYKQRDAEFAANLEAGLAARKLAEGPGYTSVGLTELQIGFAGAGRLLSSPVGPRIATLSVQGWDTHTDQGTDQGDIALLFAELDDGLARFRDSIGDVWDKTVMMIVTEFGRKVANNGNQGSDHGVGTVALLAGGAVNGGKVIADWPGLKARELFQGRDLQATTDLRSVFKGVLREHLAISDTVIERDVFPQSINVKPLKGLIKGA